MSKDLTCMKEKIKRNNTSKKSNTKMFNFD